MDWLRLLFDTSDFPERWHCGTWTSAHGWTHVIADLATWAAYFTIPALLILYVRRKSDVTFPKLFWLFGAFILACGTVHLIEASIFWWPWYRFSATFKVITAVVSWATVFAMIPLIPEALRLPGLTEMINRLEGEVASRKRVELELRSYSTQLEQRNRDLDEFTHVASHDLQEPLRKIIHFSEQLEEDLKCEVPEEAAKDLDLITDAARRMRKLIQDLLTLSHTGRSDLSQDQVNLRACVDDAVESLSARIAERGAQITIDALPTVVGDRTMLTLLFQNLLGNALKFTPPERTPRIHVTAERVAGEWVYGVRDNGIGIDPKYHAKIFDAFQRLHGRAHYEGSGIGLTICARAVTRHGGRIWVESVDAGTHFKFQLGDGRRGAPVGAVNFAASSVGTAQASPATS